ncbi:hypothetical protein B0H67DRAFT_590789 [Lasiosphaeris hirsuta]|uniref:Uncharacterized protein n=1 Tax=Lasiosphaeris hirsuta TaxID=260670 RepID=A0AA40DMH2_9PEZI|nr:hypothetical protein B0H67DRAFT_590789 [Lasiosphaeris hirsuta]
MAMGFGGGGACTGIGLAGRVGVMSAMASPRARPRKLNRSMLERPRNGMFILTDYWWVGLGGLWLLSIWGLGLPGIRMPVGLYMCFNPGDLIVSIFDEMTVGGSDRYLDRVVFVIVIVRRAHAGVRQKMGLRCVMVRGNKSNRPANSIKCRDHDVVWGISCNSKEARKEKKID